MTCLHPLKYKDLNKFIQEVYQVAKSTVNDWARNPEYNTCLEAEKWVLLADHTDQDNPVENARWYLRCVSGFLKF